MRFDERKCATLVTRGTAGPAGIVWLINPSAYSAEEVRVADETIQRLRPGDRVRLIRGTAEMELRSP
jgi:hypothetical protein